MSSMMLHPGCSPKNMEQFGFRVFCSKKQPVRNANPKLISENIFIFFSLMTTNWKHFQFLPLQRELWGCFYAPFKKISIREGHKVALLKVLWCKRRSSSSSNMIFIGFSAQIVLRGPQKSLKCKHRQAFCCKRHSIEILPQNTQDVRILYVISNKSAPK